MNRNACISFCNHCSEIVERTDRALMSYDIEDGVVIIEEIAGLNINPPANILPRGMYDLPNKECFMTIPEVRRALHNRIKESIAVDPIDVEALNAINRLIGILRMILDFPIMKELE